MILAALILLLLQTPVVLTVEPLEPGKVRVTWTDSTATETYALEIKLDRQPTNKPPQVSAGPDITVTAAPTVGVVAGGLLSGRAIDDGQPADAVITGQWSTVSGPAPVNFANASAFTTSASFTALGVYVLRLTASDGKLSGTDEIQVTILPPIPAIRATPATVPQGGTVTANWDAIQTPDATDWIGMYRVGAADNAYVAWNYVNCTKAYTVRIPFGSCEFVVPTTLPIGQYQFRLFSNNGFTLLATSAVFTVTTRTASIMGRWLDGKDAN